jgi:hypothetical protein
MQEGGPIKRAFPTNVGEALLFLNGGLFQDRYRGRRERGRFWRGRVRGLRKIAAAAGCNYLTLTLMVRKYPDLNEAIEEAVRRFSHGRSTYRRPSRAPAPAV